MEHELKAEPDFTEVPYIIVDPYARTVSRHTAKAREVWHVLGMVAQDRMGNGRHLWDSAGYIVMDSKPDERARWGCLYVDDTGWLAEGVKHAFTTTNYQAPLAGIGLVLPLEPGDTAPNGEVNVGPPPVYNDKDVAAVLQQVLWLGGFQTIEAAEAKRSQCWDGLVQEFLRSQRGANYGIYKH